MLRIISVLSALLLCTAVTSNKLDPNVFRTLSSLGMPDVGNAFNSKFKFNTFNNTLVEAHSDNATYSTDIHERKITLMIPLEQIIMKGSYASSLRIYLTDKNFLEQTSSGSYVVVLRSVDLTFILGYNASPAGFKLSVRKCQPIIGDVEMITVDENMKDSELSVETVRDLIEYASKEEYKKMFCNAMHGLTTLGVKSPVVKAILTRIETSYYPEANQTDPKSNER